MAHPKLPVSGSANAGSKRIASAVAANKKAKRGEALSWEVGDHVAGFTELVGQLDAMVQECGTSAHFDSKAWLARWLAEPLPALGGACPADLVGTMKGRRLVAAALAKIQSGAYA